MLFLIMIIFVASVLTLVRGAQAMEREFHLLDMACRSEEYMKKAIWDVGPTEEDTKDHLSWISFLCQHPLILRARGNGKKSSSLAINDSEFHLYLHLFSSLREEFLLDRSTKPPFQPTESKEALSGDFHFGRYLRCVRRLPLPILWYAFCLAVLPPGSYHAFPAQSASAWPIP